MRYSVIIPVLNEQETIAPLYEKLKVTLEGLKQPFESLFVDDASTDQSREVFTVLQNQSPHLHVIYLPVRQGQSGALQAGFDQAKGDILLTLDGDFQNDPEDIPVLLKKMEEGYDMVCGWRKHRHDKLSKRIASRLANGLRKLLTQEKIHDVGCGLKAFKKEVIQGVRLRRGMHRFFSAIAAKRGFRVGEVIVHQYRRRSGRSKYGFWERLAEGIVDLFCFYSEEFTR